MSTVIECIEGHYEVQNANYGELYVWRPQHIVVECDCGRRSVLTSSETVCECGAEHAALVREALPRHSAQHPWEVDYQKWRNKQIDFLLSEEPYRQELSRLD